MSLLVAKKTRWQRPKCRTPAFKTAVHEPTCDVTVTTSTFHIQSMGCRGFFFFAVNVLLENWQQDGDGWKPRWRRTKNQDMRRPKTKMVTGQKTRCIDGQKQDDDDQMEPICVTARKPTWWRLENQDGDCQKPRWWRPKTKIGDGQRTKNDDDQKTRYGDG